MSNVLIFSRTPGSRQPSPAEEELNKNNGGTMALQPAAIMAHKAAQMEHLQTMTHMNGLHPVLALQAHQQQQAMQNGNLLPGPPHESINQHFEHSIHANLDQTFDPSNYASGIGNGTPTVQAAASGGMDSPGVLPQNLDIQVRINHLTLNLHEVFCQPKFINHSLFVIASLICSLFLSFFVHFCGGCLSWQNGPKRTWRLILCLIGRISACFEF